MTATPYRSLTLAIHPNSKGFGWIAFENPFTIYDFGTYGARGAHKNRHSLRRFQALLARLNPETLVMETTNSAGAARSTRITTLGRAMMGYATAGRIEVALYRLSDVQSTFAHLGARTRQDIAEATAHIFPQLAQHLPARRRAWESTPWRTSLFCAAAVALTHYQRDARHLLDSLAS